MEVAKSLFKASRPHEGYSGREDYNDVVENALSDDDDGDTTVTGEHRLKPTPGGPFSAVHPSMWPQDVLKKLANNPNGLESRYDEFGFQIDEDGMFVVVGRSPKHVYKPVIEDPQDRLKWLATLEFSSKDGSTDLSWEGVPAVIPKTDKLREMVRGGIPHSLRSQLYVRFSGALKKKKASKLSYNDMVTHSAGDQELSSKDIEKDLLRSMPGNYFFKSISSPGIPRLRRVLRALAYLFPSIGYCQGMSLFCANLLLIMDEEDSFWMMSAIIEDLLPPGYFTKSLEEFESENSHGKSSISPQFFVDISGVHIDATVMETLAKRQLPEMMTILEAYDVDVKLTLFPWFSTIYATCFRHVRFTYRIWDMLFFEGSLVLFQTALGLLKKCEPSVDSAVDTSMIFTRLSNITYEIEDIDDLIRVAVEVGGSILPTMVESLRQQKKQYKMANDEGWTSEAKVSRRTLKRSKSVIEMILFGDELTEEDIKLKNIRQTEILVELRDAIKQVVRHFLTTEPNFYNESSLAVDYGIESHSSDLDRYMNVSRSRCRRAKALLDFERNDDDELGFRKNDIITIVSQKDEDCWIGELNGLRGWFPAKFVKMLDERSKKYSCAGDDSVSEAITDLVRGTLCPAIKQVLEHGMKRPHFLGGPCHPWLFIEEAATREVEKDFRSVYSRLVLCKTYRLDEDGKVLTPEELLYRCIQAVNLSHDSAHAQMDIKLRSLVCIGLNEQVLHLWLEVLCSSVETVNKWYHHWSFMNSPGWVQVKCELRLLANFSFNLNPEWELRTYRSGDSSKGNEPHLKDGVRDMLVKHHLFSWDL